MPREIEAGLSSRFCCGAPSGPQLNNQSTRIGTETLRHIGRKSSFRMDLVPRSYRAPQRRGFSFRLSPFHPCDKV